MYPRDPTADVPDIDDDPVTNLDSRLQRFEQAQQLQALGNAIRADEEAYLRDDPRYYEKLNYLRARARDELLLAGYDENSVDQELARRELTLAAQTLQRGGRPSAFVAKMAEHQGFQPGTGSHDDYDGGGYGDEADAYDAMERQHEAEGDHLSQVFAEARSELAPKNSDDDGGDEFLASMFRGNE